VALVWTFQERLLFYPRPVEGIPAAPPGWTLEEISFGASDGTILSGVLAKPPLERPALIVYYGGNAEEVSGFAARAREVYGDRAVLLMNYRGYGRSGGNPGERSMVADAIAIFDHMVARRDLDGERVALHGRSLGTGVAVQVAAARSVRCVVLTSPFSSARAVAAGIYPWLPVRWLMRHPFDSTRHAGALTVPALILVGAADQLIPRAHSDELAAAWGGPVTVRAFAGGTHDSVSIAPGYDEAIREFLGRHL
jgi:dienelactone hydrolase